MLTLRIIERRVWGVSRKKPPCDLETQSTVTGVARGDWGIREALRKPVAGKEAGTARQPSLLQRFPEIVDPPFPHSGTLLKAKGMERANGVAIEIRRSK